MNFVGDQSVLFEAEAFSERIDDERKSHTAKNS